MRLKEGIPGAAIVPAPSQEAGKTYGQDGMGGGRGGVRRRVVIPVRGDRAQGRDFVPRYSHIGGDRGAEDRSAQDRTNPP